MSQPTFPGIESIPFQGPDSQNPLAFRFYDKNRIVRGKRMEEQLRVAVCYWHTFCGNGADVFGSGTFGRAWQGDGDAVNWPNRRLPRLLNFSRSWALPTTASTTATSRPRANRWPRATTSSTASSRCWPVISSARV